MDQSPSAEDDGHKADRSDVLARCLRELTETGMLSEEHWSRLMATIHRLTDEQLARLIDAFEASYGERPTTPTPIRPDQPGG